MKKLLRDFISSKETMVVGVVRIPLFGRIIQPSLHLKLSNVSIFPLNSVLSHTKLCLNKESIGKIKLTPSNHSTKQVETPMDKSERLCKAEGLKANESAATMKKLLLDFIPSKEVMVIGVVRIPLFGRIIQPSPYLKLSNISFFPLNSFLSHTKLHPDKELIGGIELTPSNHSTKQVETPMAKSEEAEA